MSGRFDGTLRLWDAASGTPLRDLEGHYGTVNSVAFSPDGRFIVSGGWDSTLWFWDAASGELVRTLKGHNRSRRGGGWNWVGVVSGLFNPNDSGVGALERRPRHDEGYHEGGGCGRRSFAFG